MDQVVFLRFIVSCEGISVDPLKIQAIVDWPEPKNIHVVRSFLEFVTFFCRFI
jgi:hypothetical protein